MKRKITYLLVLLSAMACAKIYGPEQNSTPVVESDGIKVELVKVEDESFSVKLSPVGTAAYYSYLVDDAKEAEELDPELLYTVSYEGVAQGTIKWSEDEPSRTLKFDELVPNTTYQVYAVAGSTTGVPSEVVTLTVKTTDGGAPTFKAAVADTVVTLTFSEPVVRGKGTISSKVYASNSDDFLYDGKAEEDIAGVIDETKIAVKGNVVTIPVGGLPFGAYFSVDMAEGAFLDLSGNAAGECTSACQYDTQSGEVGGEGIWGRRTVNTFTLSPIEDKVFIDPSKPFVTEIKSAYGFGYIPETADVTVKYDSDGKSTVYELAEMQDYEVSGNQLSISFREAPAKGDVVTFTIAAGSIEDYYGNTNEKWTAQLTYSYNYTLADVVGSYSVSAVNHKYAPVSSTLVIEEVTEEEKAAENFPGGNVKITEYMGYPCALPIYATFDTDYGKLTIDDTQTFNKTNLGSEEEPNVAYMAFGTHEGDSLVLKMKETGILSAPSDVFGVLVYSTGGKYLGAVAWYVSFEAQKE